MSSPRRRLAARRREAGTGSPSFSEPVFILVATLRRPHGLKGEVLVSVETDFPERLQPGVSLLMGEEHRPLTIATRRPHAEGMLLGFKEFHSRDAIGQLRNQPLFVPVSDRPQLPEGEYYHHQLLGMRVFEEDGEYLGVLVDILNTGANDVYVVRSQGGKEILFPAIQDVVRSIDLAQKCMQVHLPPGLR